MIDITFEIGGKKVSPDRLGDELEKAILSELAEKVKRSLSSVRCPEHGQGPRVTVKGRSVNNLGWEVEGCCQKLIDLAMNKLK